MKTERDKLRACAEYADRLVDLSDGELADDERQMVEFHLGSCAGCQAELARLNASLAVLRRTGFQPVRDGTPTNFVGAPVPATYYAAAALSLIVLCSVFAAIYFARYRVPETARATSKQDAAPRPNDAGPGEAPSQPAFLDEATALHQIALIEQQARLQASLDLMPKDPWFAEQRAANEELLARFKAATRVSIIEQSPTADEIDSGDSRPAAGERL
jgi:hypothetical protein